MTVGMIFTGDMFNVFFYFCAYYRTQKRGNEKKSMLVISDENISDLISSGSEYNVSDAMTVRVKQVRF
jgi:hypothetical protein